MVLCLPIVYTALSVSQASANALTAGEIMEKVDARDDGDNIKYNQDLDEKLFTIRRLEKGL